MYPECLLFQRLVSLKSNLKCIVLVLHVQVIVQTNHMGRWQFKLCDLSASDDSKCTQLQR